MVQRCAIFLHASQRRVGCCSTDDVVRAIRPVDLLTGRIEAIGGSFFDQIPSGADIYMLVRVLHDWSDEDCLRILRACRTAIEFEWDLAHLRTDSGTGSGAGSTDRLLGGHADDGHVRERAGAHRARVRQPFIRVWFHATACHSHAIVRLDRRSSTIDRIAVRIVGGSQADNAGPVECAIHMRPRRRIGRGRRLQCAISPDMRRKKPLS